MPITPELRRKVIELSQAGYGRNKIERELVGQISRTSISAILRGKREESAIVEDSKLPGKLSSTSS